MLSEPAKNKLLEDLKRASEEVNQVKAQLNKINSEKETWFRKKNIIGQEIKSKISTIKGSKRLRNSLTSEVKDLKKKRDELNKKIAAEQKEINDLKKKQDEVNKKSRDVREKPSDLKRKIELLELKLETEPMKFDKEQKLVKEMKRMKKLYEEIKHVSKGWDDIKMKLREIKNLKQEANKYHKLIREQANDSQEHHETLIEGSKEINLLKGKEKEAYNKFLEGKDKYLSINEELKKKLEELNNIKEELKKHKVELEELEVEKKRKTLKEKEREVEQKIKKRQKLTTEDILIMQGKK